MSEPITEKWLDENGWEKSTLFFQIGGGEDEDDITIWKKGGIALAFDYYGKRWMKAASDSLNFINGFNPDQYIDFIDQI